MGPGHALYDQVQSRLYVWTRDGDDPNLSALYVGRERFNLRLVDSEHVHISALALRGASRHCVLVTDSSDIELSSLSIDYCGGQWDEDGPFYLGNGVEIAGASARVTVRDSRISDVFDSGVSPQAYLWSGFEIRDVQLVDNTISRCGLAGIELSVWAQDAHLVDTVVQGNRIESIGRGWAFPNHTNTVHGVGIYAVAPDPGSGLTGLVIRGNTIRGGLLDGIALGLDAGLVVVDDNTIEDNDGVGVFLWDDRPTTTTGAVLTHNVLRGQGGRGIAFELGGGAGVELGEGNVIEGNETSGSATDPSEHVQSYQPD